MTDDSRLLGEATRTAVGVIEDLERRARDAAEARPHLVAMLDLLGLQVDPRASVLQLAIQLRARIGTHSQPSDPA